jgi:hypothetical protein
MLADVRKLPLVAVFGIAGFALAEIYMVLTVLAPHVQGEVVPLSVKIKTVLVSAIFFGPFGAAAGTGIGLLVQGIVNWRKAKAKPEP